MPLGEQVGDLELRDEAVGDRVGAGALDQRRRCPRCR